MKKVAITFLRVRLIGYGVMAVRAACRDRSAATEVDYSNCYQLGDDCQNAMSGCKQHGAPSHAPQRPKRRSNSGPDESVFHVWVNRASSNAPSEPEILFLRSCTLFTFSYMHHRRHDRCDETRQLFVLSQHNHAVRFLDLSCVLALAYVTDLERCHRIVATVVRFADGREAAQEWIFIGFRFTPSSCHIRK